MDVHAESHEHPHQKCVFSCGPSDGEKLVDPWAAGCKSQECPQEFGPNKHVLRELGSYIFRDTPEPRQLEAPGPEPTIKQFKKRPVGGTDPPARGTDGPVRGNRPPQQEPRVHVIVENAFNCNGSSYDFNGWGSRGAPKKWPKI